jgi:hypothetical protein
MSINYGFILSIVICDRLLDQLINAPEVIYHTFNLDAQLFDTRNKC